MSFDYAHWSRAAWETHAPGADLSDGTIPALAAASAARVPDKIAVTVDGNAVTHAALDDAAARIAGWLATQRVRPGDRILLAAGASLGFVRCYLGALRAGAIVVLANPDYPAAELAHLVTGSGAVLAFADKAEIPVLRTVDVRQVPDSKPAGLTPDPEDIALLAYTSGTTGRPKGVPLSHRQLTTSIRAAMAAWRWSGDDVLAHALPLFHQHGLGGLHTALIAGSTTHILSRFTAAGLVQAVRDARATVIFGVPTSYQALADHGAVLPRTRLAVCGSAPLSPALAGRLPDVLGRLPLVRYGTTETGLDISNPVGDPHGDTIGIPLPGVQARIRDPAGHDVPPGTDGEIQLSGPQVFGGYWHDPAATEAAFTGDGWFRTGDIATVRPDGHLMIRGRTKEMIITGGLNVYPREVEIALEAHPAVLEAAVAGLPHDHWGEQVTAWTVLRPGHDADEASLIAHTRTLLAAYKCPKRVFHVTTLPRNSLGKLIRTALR
jgi:acyl-CoA synthetase (AMP-forming)/AMP-acid ligase II